MSDDVKLLHKATLRMEAGIPAAAAWGSGAATSISDADGFPFLSFVPKKTINFEQDNTIYSQGFKDLPRLVGSYVENSFSRNARFQGPHNAHLYWMFGYELPPVAVDCITTATEITTLVAGDVYEDTEGNSFTFIRKETYGSTFIYVFSADDSVGIATGDLTQSFGSGPETITPVTKSGLMYEHVFELDKDSRHATAYLAGQKPSSLPAGQKCRRATIHFATQVTDYRFINCMCKKFSFGSEAGKFWEVGNDFIGHSESKGDYNSSSWGLPDAAQTSSTIIAHHQTQFRVGTSEATLSSLGVTSWDLEVEAPLAVEQDTASGIYLMEPIFNGKYSIKLNATLSRYSSDTYQNLRDTWTDVIVTVRARDGFYSKGFYVTKAKISEASLDDSEVTKQSLVFEPYYDNTALTTHFPADQFAFKMNSPVVCMVRDKNSTYSMIQY